MTENTNSKKPSSRVIALVIAAVVALGGVAFAIGQVSAGASTSSAAAPAAPLSNEVSNDTGAAGAIQDPVAPSPMTPRTEATAVRVEIPSIGVDSGLEQLPLDSAGVLVPPVDFMSAGWYRDGTVPGDIGPAVIAGHVDSVTAPAIFARLGELAAGDQIIVTLSTGVTETFAVDSMTSAPKDQFPTEQVYGPTPTAQLRLITCDGDFDSSTGHYLDNLIVSASLVA